jgi:hypothetical protein
LGSVPWWLETIHWLESFPIVGCLDGFHFTVLLIDSVNNHALAYHCFSLFDRSLILF